VATEAEKQESRMRFAQACDRRRKQLEALREASGPPLLPSWAAVTPPPTHTTFDDE